ncbi:hypothetical protein [Nonomuraea soli]|uniref:Uncharacterized protein n=1 Tax=Nonomuraea soli TaxID=1032476 RepID=A0A7W0CNI8_9ACTN|nr:hypothetical protein [Nonomuraea soli]MBA2894441.1 hypothetical protein [Nonomuraea soli]
MKDQSKIRVLPDQGLGRDAAIGQVVEYEVDAQGAELRALVTWTEIASYRHSRTAQRTQWLPVDQTEQIDGQVYDGVTRTVVVDQPPPGAPADAPRDWPAGVPAPSASG